MSKVLSRIALDFAVLAKRFAGYAQQGRKPTHLRVNLEQTAVRAGALLDEAGRAGAFTGDPWWRDGRSPVHPESGIGSMMQYGSDAEFHRGLWTFAIGSWLAKRYQSRFRAKAGDWDWSQIATDEKGRPLGRDRKPIRGRWYKDGKPLRARAGLAPPYPPGTYSYRLEGTPAHVDDFYTEEDTLAHLRVRAEVYEDACRLLAELAGPRAEQPDAGPGGTTSDAPDEHGYVAAPSDPSAYVAAKRIMTEHTPTEVKVTAKELPKLLRDYAANRVRWTRPRGQDGKPRRNRLLVHLADWTAYIERRNGLDAEGFPRMTESEVSERAAAVRRQKALGK